MLRLSVWVLTSLLLIGPLHAEQAHYQEEMKLQEYRSYLLKKDFSLQLRPSGLRNCGSGSCLSDYDLFIHALAEAAFDNRIPKADVANWLDWLSAQPVSTRDFAHALWTLREVFPEKWSGLSASLQSNGHQNALFTLPEFADEDRVVMARDLLRARISWSGVGLYMFCREDRRYPCLFVMRDADGRLVQQRGKPWSQASLGYSRHQKKFNEVNGNTPSGVFHINGVMPYADQQQAYGQFRRLILDFLPQSPSEKNIRDVLPTSSYKANWWQEAVIARNMGRALFRIHGTGNPAPVDQPYYPFFATSGCVAQKEGVYNGVRYRDQRLLLDQLMLALDLQPVYANEIQIQGLLFVININDAQKAVQLEDLQALGILP